MSAKDRDKLDFTAFRRAVVRKPRVPVRANTYFYGRNYYDTADRVRADFTLEEIEEIIRSGDLESIRELSRYYYRTNGEYRNNIDLLASLFLYDTMIIPVFEEGKGSKTQILKAFYNACKFVDNLDLPNSLLRITKEWLKSGVYYGLLREDGSKVVIQDLPMHYCRTRFKDFNNLNILELNLSYFMHITNKQHRDEILRTFPEEIRIAFEEWEATPNTLEDLWVELPASSGGIAFTFSGDQTPLLIASIPELKKLQDAVGREEKRDENELYKLLIQKMPIDNNGELVFQLDEVADIHASVADMLADIDTVDVLTTFGDTDLESLQESTAAAQSADRIAKYKTNAYDAMGRSSLIFNADGSSSLAYSIKKDEALMQGYLNAYETWIKFLLNDRFSRPNLTFDFEILPITVFNRADLQSQYFRGAQYGYSKMYAGVAMGVKQMEQLSLMNFENDFLEMSSKMIPLQSSYTTSGVAVANEEKNNSSTQKTTITSQGNDLDNKGGRPELPDELKSEKTQANIAAAG